MNLIMKSVSFSRVSVVFLAGVMGTGLMGNALSQEPRVKSEAPATETPAVETPAVEAPTAENIKPSVDPQKPEIKKTREVHGAWVLECAFLDQKPSARTTGPLPKPGSVPDFVIPQKKSCQVTQTFSNKKTGKEFARLALAPVAKRKGQMLIGLRTVVDVSFDVPVRINITDKNFIDGKFKRCVRKHCFAFLTPKTSQLNALTKAEKVSLQFPISDGRSIRFPLSTDGLVVALDALKKNTN